jgi:hypothetical protein
LFLILSSWMAFFRQLWWINQNFRGWGYSGLLRRETERERERERREMKPTTTLWDRCPRRSSADVFQKFFDSFSFFSKSMAVATSESLYSADLFTLVRFVDTIG